MPRNELRMELPGRMAEATAGAVLATQPVLAADRVRFHGEPVVAIAAETPELAARAAELIEIDVLNSKTTLDNTEAEARGRSQCSDNSGRSRLTPTPVTGVEQTDYHGVTLFQ